MSLNNAFLEKVILPGTDLVLGQSLAKSLNFLTESQWWSRAKIEEYQNINLRKLIRHSYENVPYYNELFRSNKLSPDDIKTKSDLYKIPILTKDEVRKNFPDKIVANNLNEYKFSKNFSSGTTGLSLQYYITKNAYSLGRASGIRTWYWLGYRLGDKYIKIGTNSRSSKIKIIQDKINKSQFIFAEQLDDAHISAMIEKIDTFDPKVIRGYPFILYILAKYIEKNGGRHFNNLKALSTTANTLHPYARKQIENTFKVKVYDSYSCEGSAIFAQCETLANYHPAEEYGISEYIDDNFTRHSQENLKRHITTDLFNYATPLIRYDTQDYLALGENHKCKCGRNFTNISKILGRDGDILIMPNGKYMIVENFLLYFVLSRPTPDPISQFQIYQEKRNKIIMKLVVNEFFKEKDRKEINDYWTNHFQKENVEFVLAIVDNIPVPQSGKQRITVRNPEIILEL